MFPEGGDTHKSLLSYDEQKGKARCIYFIKVRRHGQSCQFHSTILAGFIPPAGIWWKIVQNRYPSKINLNSLVRDHVPSCFFLSSWIWPQRQCQQLVQKSNCTHFVSFLAFPRILWHLKTLIHHMLFAWVPNCSSVLFLILQREPQLIKDVPGTCGFRLKGLMRVLTDSLLWALLLLYFNPIRSHTKLAKSLRLQQHWFC